MTRPQLTDHKGLVKENERLKTIVAVLELDKLFLKEYLAARFPNASGIIPRQASCSRFV
jgi:hypothetical protein